MFYSLLSRANARANDAYEAAIALDDDLLDQIAGGGGAQPDVHCGRCDSQVSMTMGPNGPIFTVDCNCSPA